MKHLTIIFALLMLGANTHANDNLRISGFGSIVAGQVLDGSGYVADYPNVGAYDDQFDIAQETRMGVQANATINDDLSATMQVMSRANNEYEAEVEWLFVNYAISEDLELQAGKLRVPVYYYSEYMDVGIAYPWVRVPADAYSLDLTSFNGLQLNHRTFFGSTSMTSTLYAGRAHSGATSELMTFLFGENIEREFTGLIGAGVELNNDSTIVKVSFSTADLDETRNAGDFNDGTIEFLDVFFQQNFGPMSLMLEYNDYDPFYQSYFVTGTYTHGHNTYYAMWSKFDLDFEISGVPAEQHDTTSIGVRHNLGPRVAVKMDLSVMNDTGAFAVNKDPNNDGDVTILSTSLDFMF